MKQNTKYVCAFAGHRDSYQAAIALSESEMLEAFVTDAYAKRHIRRYLFLLPKKMRAKVQLRHSSHLNEERICCLWGTYLCEQLCHKIGLSPRMTMARMDRSYSKRAADIARKQRANLFLYNSYAWEAFTAAYPHNPRKVLFQYHPHPDLESTILMQDMERHPKVQSGYREASVLEKSPHLYQREKDCWKFASAVVCASSFTKLSLVSAGADPRTCHVVPYGVDLPEKYCVNAPQSFRALFLGSGIQRKGLHHLLAAWRRAKMMPESQLVLVCRSFDRELEDEASLTIGVKIIRGVPDCQLAEVFANSSVMIMPSLVEGFGLVYLEALAHGCPVLGTPNTGLPDLGTESDSIFMVTPGDIVELADQLKRLENMLAKNRNAREAAYECARRFSWERFRTHVADIAREAEHGSME